MSNYKTEHEAFVSNLSGSSAACILATLFHVPSFIFLVKYGLKGRKSSFFRDFMMLSFPLLLTMTAFAKFIYISLGIIGATIGYLLSNVRQSEEKSVCEDENILLSLHDSKYHRTSYLSLSKGATVLFTCIAILAVDFPIFPRWYGKTETYGVSLMDFGVGSFMISTACTSKFARGLPTGGFQEAFSMKRLSVLLLGVSRLISVKLLRYQEHVSEYGMHWNFFMTLFFVWVIADIVHVCTNRSIILFVSIFVLASYQWMLIYGDWNKYLFSNVRDTFIDANKEGIFSLLGYIPLYLITEVLSLSFFHAESAYKPMLDSQFTSTTNHSLSTKLNEENTKENTRSEKDNVSSNRNPDVNTDKETVIGIATNSSKQCRTNSRLLCLDMHFTKRLLVLVSCMWILWMGCSVYLQPTSRRLCNVTYVCFSLAMSFSLILCTYLADVLGGQSITIVTLNLMNQHSLVVFLVANVLTGIVNMLIQTIYGSFGFSLFILSIYTLIVTAIPWVMEMVRSRSSQVKVKSDDETKLINTGTE